MTMGQAQHAVRAALLWQLRVLAGWQPRAGAELVRGLAAWYEIANVEEQLRSFANEPAEPAYELGAPQPHGAAWPPAMARLSSVTFSPAPPGVTPGELGRTR